MRVDLRDLVTRREAAKIYKGSPQAFDYLTRRGYIKPVFVMGHTKLYLRTDAHRLRKLVLPVGRPKKVAIN